MKTLKKIKWNVILSSVLYVAVGVILLIWPEMTAKNICYIIAFLSIIIGFINLVDYIKWKVTTDVYRYNLVYGMIAILLGVFIITRVEDVISIIPFLLGFAVTISGLMKLQNALDLIRMKYSGWGAVLFIALLNIAFGIVLIVVPFESALVLFICIGIGMIYSGVSDLIATIMLSNSIKNAVKAIEAEIIE